MKPDIQNRNLEDITVTATPDFLYFELVIFLKYWKDCRMVNGLCLACGTGSHAIRDYPFRRVGNMAPVRPVLPAPPHRGNPEPIGRRAPFPPQQHDQPQRGARTKVDHGRGQVYNMSVGPEAFHSSFDDD